MVLFWIVSLIGSVLKDGYETLTFYVFYMYVGSNLVAYVQVKPLTFTYPLNCFQTPKKPPKKCVNRPAGFFPESLVHTMYSRKKKTTFLVLLQSTSE